MDYTFSGQLRPSVSVQAVAPVEELADVASQVMLDHESSTRVFAHKIAHIEHVLVQNY